ncbi:MAG: NADH oxidase [Alphaproteobacteria bacterium]|nr:NADH oxidase [Alphaproteobacteria bacterium]
MASAIPSTSLHLRTLITEGGQLEISLAREPVKQPGEDEVLIRIEATPINPSDLGLLVGPADASKGEVTGSGDSLLYRAPVPQAAMGFLARRVGQKLPCGNEGAGIVVAAGKSAEAQALMGRTVALVNGAMYGQYTLAKARDLLVLAPGTAPADAASSFVNPMTALGMVETMRMEGHTALVHTAAASNLGQMLARLCAKEGVPLVNIVRSPAQAEILKKQGASIICDSSSPSFLADLNAAVADTGATLGFDAIGGGKLASQILTAIEAAASRGSAYSRYGSSVHKQVYIYGSLDTGPTELTRSFGLAWGVGGWLLTPFLMTIGMEAMMKLRQRVADELKTTFASHYSRVISLSEALQPDIVRAYNRRATGEKYLIAPNQGA